MTQYSFFISIWANRFIPSYGSIKTLSTLRGAPVSVRGVDRGIRKLLAVLDVFLLHHNLPIRPIPQVTAANQVKEKGKAEIFTQAFHSTGDYGEIVITGTSEKKCMKHIQ
ncbi:MAG: hypothetical protein MRK01_09235 [Candidatus Scalindua sp.]|nr:hypothetical protein [Candidatus Scalindua sp.]